MTRLHYNTQQYKLAMIIAISGFVQRYLNKTCPLLPTGMPKVLSEYEEENLLQGDKKETFRGVERAKGQNLECRLIERCARRRIAPFSELVGDVMRDADRH